MPSTGSVTRNAAVVALGTLVSRLLGLAREAVMFAMFPTALLDLWVVAFTIPNTLRGLLAEGGVSAAYVPIYTELRATQGDGRAREFAARSSGALGVVLIAVSLLGMLLAPALVTVFAPGYLETPDRFRTTVDLTRAIFPYIFFAGVAALSAGTLNAHGRFAVPAMAPALLNIALIAAPFVLIGVSTSIGLEPVGALALGALIGGVLQIVVQWPELKQIDRLQPPRLSLSDPAVRKAGRLLIPVAAGLGIYQLNIILSRALASLLPPGSQGYLWAGQRIVEIPQGMFAMAVATATLPVLSELRARDDREALTRTVIGSLRSTLFIAIAATAALVALSHPIVATLYQRGEFGPNDAREAGYSLAFQAAGVWAIASVRVVAPVFHAHNDTRIPVFASVCNLIVFAAAGLGLSPSMRHAGIAAAISLASVGQLAFLIIMLYRKLGIRVTSIGPGVMGMIVAASVAGAASYLVSRAGNFDDGSGLWDALILFISLTTFGACYLGVSLILKEPSLVVMVDRLRRRLRR